MRERVKGGWDGGWEHHRLKCNFWTKFIKSSLRTSTIHSSNLSCRALAPDTWAASWNAAPNLLNKIKPSFFFRFLSDAQFPLHHFFFYSRWFNAPLTFFVHLHTALPHSRRRPSSNPWHRQGLRSRRGSFSRYFFWCDHYSCWFLQLQSDHAPHPQATSRVWWASQDA